MTARADKQASMDAEAAAWRRLADHLAECAQKGRPLADRDCEDCRRLHAAHRRLSSALHRPAPPSFANLAGLFL